MHKQYSLEGLRACRSLDLDYASQVGTDDHPGNGKVGLSEFGSGHRTRTWDGRRILSISTKPDYSSPVTEFYMNLV